MHSTGVPVCKDEVRAVRGGFGVKGWSPRGSEEEEEEEEEASEEAEPRGVGECSRVAWAPPRRQTENRAGPPPRRWAATSRCLALCAGGAYASEGRQRWA
ncbi:hypothetical protein L1887_49890 [Cichorium endivia]|nr:hypothetical protein L1887_49890 [Cichorium endivia]